jgi:hypothetical protein
MASARLTLGTFPLYLFLFYALLASTICWSIESIVSKLARMLRFIKIISRELKDPYTYKTLYVAFVRPGLEYASCVWSPHQEFYSARIEHIQHNFKRFELRGLGWTSQPLLPYESACPLLWGWRLYISVRRKVAAAFFVRVRLPRWFAGFWE